RSREEHPGGSPLRLRSDLPQPRLCQQGVHVGGRQVVGCPAMGVTARIRWPAGDPMRIVPIPCLSDNYAYLLVCRETKEAAIVDVSEPGPVLTAIEQGAGTQESRRELARESR